MRRILIAVCATVALVLGACVVGSAHRAAQPTPERRPEPTLLPSSKVSLEADGFIREEEVESPVPPPSRPTSTTSQPTFLGSSKSDGSLQTAEALNGILRQHAAQTPAVQPPIGPSQPLAPPPPPHVPTPIGSSKSALPLGLPTTPPPPPQQQQQQAAPAPAPTYLPTSKSAPPMPRPAPGPQQAPAQQQQAAPAGR